MKNNVNIVYACRYKHRYNIGWVVLPWSVELYVRLLTRDRDWETHCSSEIQTSWLRVVVSSCFSILYPAYWQSEGDETWTTTTAGQKEMGRKNGDAVRIMLLERQQENWGGTGSTWIDVQNWVRKFGENSSYPSEHVGLLLTSAHVSGGRKRRGKQDRYCNWDEDLFTMSRSHELVTTHI